MLTHLVRFSSSEDFLMEVAVSSSLCEIMPGDIVRTTLRILSSSDPRLGPNLKALYLVVTCLCKDRLLRLDQFAGQALWDNRGQPATEADKKIVERAQKRLKDIETNLEALRLQVRHGMIDPLGGIADNKG